MAIDIDEPLLLIEHDHTRLDVQLEDLEAIARQAFSATDDDLLQDARVSWEHLQDDIYRHFEAEEHKLFDQLIKTYTDLKKDVETLVQQHRMLAAAMTGLGRLLEGTCSEVAGRKEIFDARWKEMQRLWNRHSHIEWAMLLSIRQRMEEEKM